jgi:CHAT domain-containing protein
MSALGILRLGNRCLLILVLCISNPHFPAFCQETPDPNSDLPPELYAADSEINGLLQTARSDSDSGNYEAAFSNSRKALQLAQKKGLLRDKAIAEAWVAAGNFSSGKVEDSLKLYQSSLQDAIESSNVVLEADVLVTIATLLQIRGNSKSELDLLATALDRANQSKNLYVKARVLGELGHVQVLSGKTDEGRKSIEEALRIDKANGYKFESLHSVYLAYAILSEPKPDLAAAIAQLEVSRDLAMKANQYIPLVLAENALGGLLIHKGEVLPGIAILENLRDGRIMKDGEALAMPETFRSAIALPMFAATLLESLAQGYEAAHESDKALQAWNELYTSARSTGNTAIEGEAAFRMANIYKSKKDIPNAVKYFSQCAEVSRKLQNKVQLSQALIGEAVLLIQMGNGEQAVPLENEIAEIGRITNNRQLEFFAHMVLAEIYQPAGDFEHARDVLEKAQALIRPGPMDSEIASKSVVEDYTRLADVYRALQKPTGELFAIIRAIVVTRNSKDKDTENRLIAYLNQRVRELNVYNQAKKAITEGRLADALTYEEVIFVYQGSPKDWLTDENWNRICNLPYDIVKQSGGPEALTEILTQIGSLPTLSKVPILQVLSQYFMLTGPKLDLAEHYALEADSVLIELNQADGPWKVRTVCNLAIAYAQEVKLDLAKEKNVECMALAEKAGDKQSLDLANAANVLVHVAAKDLNAAQKSLTYQLESAPTNAGIHQELAVALAKSGRYQDAQSELNTALRIYESKGDKASVARAYGQMAISLDTDKSPEANREQLTYFESSMTTYRELGDLGGQATVAGSMGLYYLKLEKYSDALANLRLALTLANKAGESGLIASTLASLGQAYSANRDKASAAEFHRKAADAFHDLNDPTREAFSLVGLYWDLKEERKSDEALSVLTQAKSAAARSSSAIVKVYVQLDFGWAYWQQGELELSALAFREAQRIAEEAGDLARLAESRVAFAELKALLGDWEGAADQSGEALKLYQQLKDKHGESTADAELGRIYGDRTSSIRDVDKSISYFETAKNLGYERSLELDQFEIYLQSGQYPEALRSAREGLKDCLIRKDTECQANALISLAEAERRSGDLPTAATTLSKAERLVAKENDFYLHGRLLYAQANQERASGHFKKAVELYEKVVVLVEQTKASPDNESQRSVEETYRFIYDELIDALYSLAQEKNGSERDAYAAEALKYAEANKAREFAYSWGKTFLYAAKLQLPADVQEQERRVLSRRESLEAELQMSISSEGNSSGRDLGEIRQELTAANEDVHRLTESLRTSYPAYTALKYPQTVTLQQIPLRLAETLIETKMTDDSTFVWIIRRDPTVGNRVLAFYKVPQKREWFEKRVLSLRHAFNAPWPLAYDPRVSEELFQALFPRSYGTELLRSKTIIFIPDDVLFLIPFELLSPQATTEQFEFLEVPSSYYPSALSLQMARAANHTSDWKKDFLGVGDPITSREDPRFNGIVPALVSSESESPNTKADSVEIERGEHFPEKAKTLGYVVGRLKGTEIEVHEIAALFSQRNDAVDVRLGVQATRQSILETDLAQFRFIHFATHGILPVNGNIPEPALVLSFDGTTLEHMYLFASDILRLKLNADSVVLSACETGSGNVSRAEGVMSLGRAFMAAGASSVTVSLWKVSDDATQMFMGEYYKNLLDGKAKPESLALARSYLFSKGFKNPFFWAPFVLIGE